MKNTISFIIALFFLLSSCSKDKINPDCFELPNPPVGPGYIYTYDYPRLGGPYFNPNNSDEFICGSILENFQGKELIKYNLVTREKEVIYSGDIFSSKWGINNWILFRLSALDGQIWKMKSNGDSLTQLTFGINHSSPEWRYDGEQFVSKVFDQGTAIYDKDGNLINHYTDFNINGAKSWQHPDFIISNFSDHIYGFNPEDASFSDIHIPENPISIGDIVVLPEQEEIIWSNSGEPRGIYKTNIETEATELIKMACESKFYIGISYSPKTKKIITNRVRSKIFERRYRHVTSDLVLMNLDGSGEEVLEISE